MIFTVRYDDLFGDFMKKIKINDEVLCFDSPIVTIDTNEINFLKDRSDENVRKRIRICAHRKVEDAVHEMIIVHQKGAFVPPHKHLGKSESFHVIEGEADVILFDDEGNLTDVIQMGNPQSGKSFYNRISSSVFHSLLIRSGYFIFHETTSGPFRKEETLFASWAPPESDRVGAEGFMKNLKESVDTLLQRKCI